MALHVHYPWIALYVLFAMRAPTPASTAFMVPTIEEVCLTETFHAQCSDSSVISLQSALYGRMRPSDCDPHDTGNYGCVANVMGHMDTQCSGKSECRLAIPDETLSALNPCGRGDYPYMEISYLCTPVLSSYAYQDVCGRNGYVPVSANSDVIIASSIAYTRHDTGPCSLTITGESGQRINVTMVDFTHAGSTDADFGAESTCHKYAVLTESPSGIPKPVCRGSERETTIYVSESNQLEVQVSSTDGFQVAPNFLLKFSAVGCTDPELNGNELTDRSPQTAELYCHSTGKTQHLSCQGRTWDASVRNCKAMIGGVAESWSMKGLAIILVIGIITGAIIACSVMSCVWFCVRRRNTRKPPRQIIYYEGTSPWNAAPPIDNWDGNNALIVDYDTRTRRKKDYEPVYHPLQHDAMMVGSDGLPIHSGGMNRNIFDDLPPLPPIENGHSLNKPV